jgi:TolA-binding protein
MNSTMVVISKIVTLIFIVILIIQWWYAAQIQTQYGSPATSLPYILGMLTTNGLIPSILWLITYFTATKLTSLNNQNPKNKFNTSGNSYSSNNPEILKSNDYIYPEINDLRQRIISFNLELNNLRNEGNLLNRSINQNLINQNSYNSKMDELDSAFFSIENKKSKYENRLNAIINISDTLRDLDELCEKNLISFHEKETKRNELINQEINR